MKEYRVREGRRYIGLQMAQSVLAGFWAHIFIDCPTCDQSIGLVFNSNEASDRFTNEEFLQIVRNKKWSIIPNKYIACSSCNNKINN